MSDTTTPNLAPTPNAAYFAGAGANQYIVSPNNPNPALRPATVPTTTNVTNTPTPVVPNVPTTTGGITTATAYNAGLGTYVDSQIAANKDVQDKQSALQVAQASQTQTKGALATLMGDSSVPNATATATAQTGVDPTAYFADVKAKQAEIQSLTDQYNKALSDVQTQKSALQDGLTTNNFANNESAQIDRNAAPSLNSLAVLINSKTATLATEQGNFTQAEDFIQKATDAATAAKKDQLTYLTTLYNENQDTISSLDSTYKDALNQAITFATDDYNSAKSDATAIGKLMTDPSTSGAGITLNDTLAQAQQKASTYLATHPSIQNTITANGRILGLDSQGNVIKDYGAAPANANTPLSTSTTDDLNTILKNGGSSANWSLKDWGDTEADFVSKHPELTPTKARSVFEAQFPKPTAAQSNSNTPSVSNFFGGISSNIGNFLSNLFK